MATTQIEGQVKLKNVRLSFPTLFKAEGIKGDPNSKPRFGATFLISKDDKAQIKLIEDEIKRLEKLKFKGKALSDKDISFHDGDSKDFDGYEGHMYLSANRSESQGRPQVVDRNLTPLTADDAKIYAGCYVNAVVSFFVPKDWKKICCSLEVVQFVKDGEAFGAGRVKVDEVLEVLDDEDDDI